MKTNITIKTSDIKHTIKQGSTIKRKGIEYTVLGLFNYTHDHITVVAEKNNKQNSNIS